MNVDTLFLIEQGPDLRAFVYSGFAEALAERGEVAFLAPEGVARAYIPDRFRVFDRDAHISTPPAKVARAARLHDLWTEHAVQRAGGERWLNFAGHEAQRGLVRRLRDAALALPIPGKRKLAARTIARAAPNAKLDALLREVKPERIVLSNAATPLAIETIRTARGLDIATIVALNSWKDAFARPSVPVPAKLLACETETARNHLHQFNDTVASRSIVIPSLHAETFRRDEYRMGREEFCRAAGLDPAKPFICYTAAAPRAVSHERAIVADLIFAMAREEALRDVQLLIRLNPMDDDPEAWHAMASESVTIQRPDWDWDSAAIWSCPTPDDCRTWISTVAHAAANVSISSTVTRDFLSFGHPVVNILFDAPDAAAGTNCRFWEAPFYRELHEHPLVTPARNVQEIVAALPAALATRDGDPPIAVLEDTPFAWLLEAMEVTDERA
ncbi:MAG: hypothetical protein WBA68_13040 [Alteraurantiacibacter sp.]